jgi:hypothetical protein
MTMPATIAERDIHDIVENRPHNAHILSVQPASYDRLRPNSWSTLVFQNVNDAKVVLRQHSSGTTRIKVTPALTVDLVYPETYEITLTPDVPFSVLTALLEIVD